MNVSFQLRHSTTATISLKSAFTPLHSALFIMFCVILIMFSSAWNQWTLCPQIVISPDTAHLGAGGSSHLASADILIYARSVCEGHRWNAFNCQLRINCPLEEGSPAQLNLTCIDLANYQPHSTRYCLSSMFGPLRPNPKIASASSSSVKRAAAWARMSNHRFYSTTQHDGWQFLLSHVPHLLQEV